MTGGWVGIIDFILFYWSDRLDPVFLSRVQRGKTIRSGPISPASEEELIQYKMRNDNYS